MKFTRYIACCFLLLLSGSLASAQEPTGKFSVTHDTHWGTAVLPPGSYSVSVHSGPVPYVLVTSENRDAISIMAVAQYLETAKCKTSSLEMEQSEGAWSVRSLCFESSLAVYFSPQRTTQVRTAAAAQVATAPGAN